MKELTDYVRLTATSDKNLKQSEKSISVWPKHEQIFSFFNIKKRRSIRNDVIANRSLIATPLNNLFSVKKIVLER